MNEDAQQFLEVCFKRQIPAKVVLNPRRFREHRYVADRAAILRELKRVHGWTVTRIAEFCPLSERVIERAVSK